MVHAFAMINNKAIQFHWLLLELANSGLSGISVDKLPNWLSLKHRFRFLVRLLADAPTANLSNDQ